jgi:hypothetical protein
MLRISYYSLVRNSSSTIRIIEVRLNEVNLKTTELRGWRKVYCNPEQGGCGLFGFARIG